MAFKNKTYKKLACKECGEEVKGVGEETVEVTCWKCVHRDLTKGFGLLEEEDQPKPSCKK